MMSEPLIVHCCHCTKCQCQTGSAFVINALIEADRVALLEGEIADVTVPSPSGKSQRISRCPRCQVAVWSRYLVMSGSVGEAIVFVRVGTLDEPSRLPPDIHIHTASKLPWVVLPPGARAVDEYYVTRDVWSPESRARLKTLLQAAADEAG